MENIKFANGEVHSCSYLSTLPSKNLAYIAIDDVSFLEAARIFSDEEKTREMEYGNYHLIGYTNLLYVMNESFGIKACLSGGHDELS